MPQVQIKARCEYDQIRRKCTKMFCWKQKEIFALPFYFDGTYSLFVAT